MKHRSWIVCTGFLWAIVGFFLLYKGLHLVAEGSLKGQKSLAMTLFGSGEKGATSLVAIGLLIGFIKGRFVLSKTVKRVCSRIVALPLPIRIGQVYSTSYLVLIGSMMLLGMLLRFIPIPLDVKGVIDVAIGSALLNGSMLYFRSAQSVLIAETHL